MTILRMIYKLDELSGGGKGDEAGEPGVRLPAAAVRQLQDLKGYVEKAKALKEGMLEMQRLWNDMNFDVFQKMLLGVDARPTVMVNAVIEGAVGGATSGASTSEGAVGEAVPKVACAKCGRLFDSQ